ncbi:hypothetical protein ACFX13_022257 [Malus domestica]
MVMKQQPLLHLTNRSSDTSSSATPILVASSLIAPSTAAKKSNSSRFLIFGKQPRRGSPNRCPCHATSSAHAKPILGFNQAKQHKQWPLPHHLLGPCQADSWPLPADVPHHLDGCPMVAPPKKKIRRIKFSLHRCGAEKTKTVLCTDKM